METTESLDGNDPAAPDSRRCSQGGIIAAGDHIAGRIPELEIRTAIRAGIGLRVKAAVTGILVFQAALRAHRERTHRGVDTVVGEGFDDGKTRTAVRAVGERVAVTPVLRAENLRGALG